MEFYFYSRTVSTFLILQLLNKQPWELGLEITELIPSNLEGRKKKASYTRGIVQ